MHDHRAMGILAAFVTLSALVTWLFAALAGRRIARRFPVAGRFASTLFVPCLMLLAGAVMFLRERHIPGDAPAMLLLGYIMGSAVSFAASVPVTLLVLGRGGAR